MSSNETLSEIEEPPTYVSSIPVPNVQELVRKDPLQVPQRYVRDQQDRPKDTDMSHLSSLIPIIDMSLLLMGNKDELNKLDLACQEWGFFQVVNHGVPNEVLQKMKDSAAEFFDLPLEEKNKYAMPPNDIQGYGHAYIVSEEQILDWSDQLILVIMGMDKETLLELHKQLVQAYRVNYYPPCSKPDQVLGVSPHSDPGTITILMQDDYICGLQIQHKGEWVPINPIPNALVVNIGDMTEIWSNGKYKSINHRAVANPNKARISYASFLSPQDQVEVEPLDQMLNSEKNPQKMYKRVKYGEYLRNSMKMKMEGKAHTKMAKID
ncbi:Oxoglutarate/iron-dependent dioxygenase [Corchorus olitorius]|uniref:Oxoglutarate/iron-dependent dioxygenase n=1 Tax=Corchorus olitorius TaxID=93759 RepID=A0A1R3JR13_9ROSI|nr:Oxoglutarate/iron-dependent dioxygenase [Corchorus olitorius]